MPGTPIALHESPCSGDVDRVPRVPEPVVLEPYARLVAGGFAVTFDHHAMKTGETGICWKFVSKFKAD